MSKKTLLVATVLIMALATNAQRSVYKALAGRWRTRYASGNYCDMNFFSDSTGAMLYPNGLLSAYINIKYDPDIKNGLIKLKYTFDIHRKKNPNYVSAEIKFVNDSTFLYRADGTLPAHADTNNRKLLVYRKIKIEDPGTRLRLPNYYDLIGSWAPYHEKKKSGKRVIFIDKNHVRFKTGDTARELNYRVDFTKQPIPIDFFYYKDTSKALPAFLMFITVLKGEDVLRLELFPKKNRGDHLTLLGDNAVFVRDTGNH
jgi:hypothetical protein